MSFQIRHAVETDYDSMVKVHIDSIRTYCSPFYSQEVIEEWFGQVNREKYLGAIEFGATFFVAEEGNNTILGFCEVHRARDSEFSAAFFVSGRAGRKGIGSALYRVAEELALQEGAESIALNSTLAAIQFYEKNGFTRLDHFDSEMSPGGKTMELVKMVKSLSSQ